MTHWWLRFLLRCKYHFTLFDNSNWHSYILRAVLHLISRGDPLKQTIIKLIRYLRKSIFWRLRNVNEKDLATSPLVQAFRSYLNFSSQSHVFCYVCFCFSFLSQFSLLSGVEVLCSDFSQNQVLWKQKTIWRNCFILLTYLWYTLNFKRHDSEVKKPP